MLLKGYKTYSDYAWLALRLTVAVVLVIHGHQKLFGGVEGFASMLNNLSIPAPLFMAWVVTLLEFVGGIALAVGICTREVAALLAIQFAVILVYVKKFDFPQSDVDLVIFGAVLALALAGAGALSLDAKMANSRKGAASTS